MKCRIENLVCEGVASLDEGYSVQEAAELMGRQDAGSLVVTADGRVVGLFTEHDLLRRVVGSRRDPATVSLGEVCSRNLVAIDHDSSCQEAVRKMRANYCRRLVVYRDNRFAGLVNLTDVAHALTDRSGRKDLVVNLFGAVTPAVAIGVIGLLISQLPQMLQLAQRVSGH
jgi:signal-transduction protein with cAMP-binding, CBS, and nucleotidyltransferase domain